MPELLIIGATIGACYIIVTLSHLLGKIHISFYFILPVLTLFISILLFAFAVIIQHTQYAGYFLYGALGLFWAAIITLIINIVTVNKSRKKG